MFIAVLVAIFEPSKNRFTTGHRLSADVPFFIVSNIITTPAVAVLVMIFHTEHRPRESQNLAEGDKD